MHSLRFGVKICMVILACNMQVCFAQIKTGNRLDPKITQLINARLPNASLGVCVQDAKTGETIYDYHANNNFLPASTAKLFTAAAALKSLGPDYRYETALFYDPHTIKAGVHVGDIALQFKGDPSLAVRNVQDLLQELRNAKITKIEGNLLIDDSIFVGPLYALGWSWDSTPWHHAAPSTAIIIDRNQFAVTFLPAQKVGDPVVANLDPATQEYGVKISENDIHAVTYDDSENLCQLVAAVDDQNHLELGGCWPIGSKPVQLRFAIKNPRLLAAQVISKQLQSLGIKVSGQIKFSARPIHMVKLAQHSSAPLSTLLKPVLSESNNLYAESLTKTLGAQMYGVGSFKTGTQAMQKILLQTTGIDLKFAKLVDGSGESRYNLLTPMHLAHLLFSMRKDEKLSEPFRNALAISGMEGSLHKRFGGAKPQVFAKTGTLHGVSSLAGYFTTKQQRELIIAIMINHAMENNASLKQFEEELCYLFMDLL